MCVLGSEVRDTCGQRRKLTWENRDTLTCTTSSGVLEKKRKERERKETKANLYFVFASWREVKEKINILIFSIKILANWK